MNFRSKYFFGFIIFLSLSCVYSKAFEIIGDIPGELQTQIIEGPPAEAILSVADTRNNDLIIMGTRGLGKIAGLLIGSQSQKVISHAKCPVMLVR